MVQLVGPRRGGGVYESATLRRFAGVDLVWLRCRMKRQCCASSTKNLKKERDPAMHQTRKRRQWYFGLKAHVGVDSKQGMVHSVCTSAANVSNVHMLPDLLYGEERKVCGDGGYQGQTEAVRQAAHNAQDMTCRRTKFKNYVDDVAKKKITAKSKVRAKVEHVFRILKRVFGFDMMRYRGSAKNHHRLCANFAFINLYLHRKRLAGPLQFSPIWTSVLATICREVSRGLPLGLQFVICRETIAGRRICKTITTN